MSKYHHDLRCLYVTYVRPHLEYASSIWCPYNKSHINMIENVQRRATKLTHSLRNLDYNERLARLGLTTLADRRKRGDVIQIFKIISGQNIVNRQVDIQVYECLSENGPANNLRHTRKLIKPKTAPLTQRENFFTHRIVDLWNNLPESVCNASSVDNFKKRYDEYINSND